MQIEDPAISLSDSLSIEGTKLVAVDVEVANESSKYALSVDHTKFDIVDIGGFCFSATWAQGEERLDSYTLAVGEKARGWLAFQIPNESVPRHVKLEIVYMVSSGLFIQDDRFVIAGLQ